MSIIKSSALAVAVVIGFSTVMNAATRPRVVSAQDQGGFAATVFGMAAGEQGAPRTHVPITVHPWCYDGTSNTTGTPLCAYDSYEQCFKNARQCVRNPWSY